MNAFCDLYFEKTGYVGSRELSKTLISCRNKWRDRDTPRKVPGKFFVVQVDYGLDQVDSTQPPPVGMILLLQVSTNPKSSIGRSLKLITTSATTTILIQRKPDGKLRETQ